MIVPVAISGAFEAFPRTKKYPSPFKKRVVIEYGEPIPPEVYRSMTEEQANEYIVKKISEMYERNRPRPKSNPK